jgi:hypothetical protein
MESRQDVEACRVFANLTLQIYVADIALGYYLEA